MEQAITDGYWLGKGKIPIQHRAMPSLNKTKTSINPAIARSYSPITEIQYPLLVGSLTERDNSKMEVRAQKLGGTVKGGRKW